jgi:hypothetical protein
MGQSKLERASRLHVLADRFRDFAAETDLPDYRARMLQIAAELDMEAAKLDAYRRFHMAS